MISPTPHWWQKAVIYQIYPRSFQDSNGDGIGDLPGIISRLDYLNDGTENSLGIDAIWLSPIYPSPMKDFGYDVADYRNIDPMFGTLDDFETLIQQAHHRNIKILMDYIPNHTSSQHPWFVESRMSLDNPRRDWYIWRDSKENGDPPNNWLSVFGGSAWEFDEKSKQYYFHSFDKDQPDLNWRNPEVVEEMLTILRFWLDKGVDGFRIDAYDFLYKHTDFMDEPSNPTYILGTHGPHDSLVHLYSFAQPETLTMIKKIAEVLEEYQDRCMVTEVYAKVDQLVEMYSHVSREWYAPFNFGLILLPWRADIHRTYIDEFDEKVGQNYYPTYVLGNHDQPRIVHRVGREQARVGAMLQLTLRGLPFIYYGEEIGMTNGEIPQEKIVDTFELNSPGLGLGRDPERTPMQWDETAHAGFSQTQGDTWLPVNPDCNHYNVAIELKDPKSILSLYKTLIKLRKKRPALTLGTYQSLEVNNENVFAYTRIHQTETIIVVLNYSNQDQVVELPFKQSTLLLDTDLKMPVNQPLDASHLHLSPHQGLILEV